MLWLNARIDRIQKLLNEGSLQCLIYAALESRLAIEHLCYERLQIAHKYIAHGDLKRWQPRHIVTQLIQEVDSHIASSFTVSMSTTPVQSVAGEMTTEEYEQHDYVEIGKQSGFDPGKLGKLWHALGNFLHIRIPESREDVVADCVDEVSLVSKIEEALSELKRVERGNLVFLKVGEIVSFECECGASNKRPKPLLTDGQLVSCINPNCIEKWKVEIKGEDIYFKQQSVKIKCHACSEAIDVPLSALPEAKPYNAVRFRCRNCGAENYLRWKLMHEKLAEPDK